MYQRITIVGNLGRDPELRYTPNGTPVAQMSVATSNTYTNQKGEQVKETAWFRVSVFGKQAESCSQYLSKGRQVLVEGRLRPDPSSGGPQIFTRKDGTAGASYEITATTVRFLGGGQGRADSGAAVGEENIPADEIPEDEIPF